jgi:hypothetical protein
VVGGSLAIGWAEEDPARGAEQDLLQRIGEISHLNVVVASPGRQQRRLVGQVGEVGAHHPRCG